MPVDQPGVFRLQPRRNPKVNIAFAAESQDDGVVALDFAGVTANILQRIFSSVCCACGMASRFTMEQRQAPVWRNGYLSEWTEVTLYDCQLSAADAAATIEQYLRHNVNVNYVDQYAADDFLNLTHHDPGRLLNAKKKTRKRTESKQQPMANIYVKVPWYVAWHFRGRDENHQLTEWEPVEFSDFDHEYQVLVNNLRYIPEQNQTRMCLSQQAWKNILHGKASGGGPTIIQRSASEWPTPQETAALTGLAMSPRHAASDYLCIRMPREVYLNKRVYRTNSCYALSYDAAYFFAAMLADRFSYEYTQWMKYDKRMAESQGFKRKIIDSQERYFVQYNFPVIIDPKLRESLRRQHTRFVERGLSKPRYTLQFNQSFLEHVSEDDQRKIEANKKKNNNKI